MHDSMVGYSIFSPIHKTIDQPDSSFLCPFLALSQAFLTPFSAASRAILRAFSTRISRENRIYNCMKIVNAYGQRSDAATYNIRFVSDDHKTRSPIKLLVPMLLFGTVVAGATLTTWPPTLPSILTGGVFLIVGFAVGLSTGALMFRRRSPTSSIDHAAASEPTSTRTNTPIVISHSDRLREAIKGLSGTVVAEVNATLPGGNTLISPVEQLLFLIDELQPEHEKGTHTNGTHAFNPREMFDRLAGLATHIYHLDIFMIFEREVPERVIGNERGIASAWFNLLLDEIAVRRQHQQAMAVHVTVLISASTSRNDTCLLCVTFGGQTDPGEIMPDGGLSTRVSQRTRERANAADVSIESSLITIPVIATETAAPQLTGEVPSCHPIQRKNNRSNCVLNAGGCVLYVTRRTHRSF